VLVAKVKERQRTSPAVDTDPPLIHLRFDNGMTLQQTKGMYSDRNAKNTNFLSTI
jgi:hypothetical protein